MKSLKKKFGGLEREGSVQKSTYPKALIKPEMYHGFYNTGSHTRRWGEFPEADGIVEKNKETLPLDGTEGKD